MVFSADGTQGGGILGDGRRNSGGKWGEWRKIGGKWGRLGELGEEQGRSWGGQWLALPQPPASAGGGLSDDCRDVQQRGRGEPHAHLFIGLDRVRACEVMTRLRHAHGRAGGPLRCMGTNKRGRPGSRSRSRDAPPAEMRRPEWHERVWTAGGRRSRPTLVTFTVAVSHGRPGSNTIFPVPM